MYGPVSGSGLINDGGFLMLASQTPDWPTSDSGLSPGEYFSNGLFVNVVTPLPLQPGVAPLFWPNVTASQLLLYGSAALNSVGRFLQPNQLFLNGGFVCVATPGQGLFNAGGVLQLTDPDGWPTDPTGFLSGALYNAGGGAIYCVAGTTPNPTAPPLMYGIVTSDELLAVGGSNIPIVDPRKAGQIWNNTGSSVVPSSEGILCVSLGL